MHCLGRSHLREVCRENYVNGQIFIKLNSGPEIDDDENSDENDSPTNGIDDGFFNDSELDGPTRVKPTNGNGNGNGSRRGSKLPVFPTTFPLAPPDFGHGIVITGDTPRIIPDINVYQHKKTLAQGFMDLALLSANANQLRYVLEARTRHPYYYFSLTFIIASLIIQVIVGVGLVLSSRYNIKDQDDICKADRINNLTTVGILMIVIINVFVSAFGVAD